MMHSVNIFPVPSCLRVQGTRLKLVSRHPTSKNFRERTYQELCHTSRYHSTHPLQYIALLPKHCSLCGNVSRSLGSRTLQRFSSFLTRDFGSDDEDPAGLGDIDFDEGVVLNGDTLSLIRVKLYPGSSNPVLDQLTQAASVQDVFSIIEKHENSLTPEQVSQAVVSLWDLQKVYGRYGIDFPSLKDFELANFLATILKHPTFKRLLARLESVYLDLDYNAVSCMLLYLNRLGISDSSSIMQKLVLLSLQKLDRFSLTALSRLSVYLQNQGLGAYYLQSKILPILAENVMAISKPDDLRLATICLQSSVRLLSESLFEKYLALLEKFLEEGWLAYCEPKTVIKILRFLNQRRWEKPTSILQRELMLCLVDRMNELNELDISTLNQYFLSNVEPREMLHRIQERARYLLEVNKSSSRRARLMLCIAPFSSSKTHSHIEEFIVEHLNDRHFFDLISVLFKCLRSIRTSNFKLCNAFWNKALNSVEMEIKNTNEWYLGSEEGMLRKVYQHYMYFNNNLGGTYRNHSLEKRLAEYFTEDLRGKTGILPRKVSHMTSFLVAYNRGNGLPEDIMDRVIACAHQFNVWDIKTLSRGIQISLAFNLTNVQRSYTEQIASLCHILNSCTENLMKKQKSLTDVCGLTQAFLNRHGSPRTHLFDSLIEAHLPVIGELNSRNLKDLSMHFHRTNYLCSEILAVMVKYIIDNQEYILADTMERFLRCLYSVGYHPKSSDDFFQACHHIYQQDKSLLLGLSHLEMSLALCFYGHLPARLIHEVFNITFLDKLDEEIAVCYSKGTYPYRVRHALMELNRAVCIDHPEEKIPWFHEKYCEDLLQTVAAPNKPFHCEVHQALSQLVGGSEVLRANVKTPYYYLLDFEFILDENNKPVPVSEYASVSQTTGVSKNMRLENTPGYKRMAILLREDNSYCVNVRHLMGRHQMERRHLEILGYTVVEVPHFMWYSMAHAHHEDRVNYLKTLVYN